MRRRRFLTVVLSWSVMIIFGFRVRVLPPDGEWPEALHYEREGDGR